MSYPFKLPEGNSYVEKIPRDEIKVIGQGSPGRPIAMYKNEKVMDY